MRIKLCLISGFLGAGKTTFLQNILGSYEGQKVGVLINEVGKFGVDGVILQRDGILLTEIHNGSIFCSCLKVNFVKALIEFSQLDIEILLVESSGMADPSNVHHLLAELDGKVGRPYEYLGSICVVDAANFLKHVQSLISVQNQILSSSLILLNKIDLVNQEVQLMIESAIHQINPLAYVHPTLFSEVPLEVIQKTLSDHGYIEETTNTCDNRPTSYGIEYKKTCEKDALLSFIEEMKPFAIRMKGFAKGKEGWMQINVIDDLIAIEKAVLPRKDDLTITRLILIGRTSTNLRKEILKTWKKYFEDSCVVYA